MSENKQCRKRSDLPRRVSSMMDHVTRPDDDTIMLAKEEEEELESNDSDISSSEDGSHDRKRHKSYHHHYCENANVNGSMHRSIMSSSSSMSVSPTPSLLFHATITPVSSQVTLDQIVQVVPAAAVIDTSTTGVSPPPPPPQILHDPIRNVPSTTTTTTRKLHDNCDHDDTAAAALSKLPSSSPSSFSEFVSFTPRHTVSDHHHQISSWWKRVVVPVVVLSWSVMLAVAVISRFGPLPSLSSSSSSSLYQIPQQPQPQPQPQPDTVCVSGGGFSGFWFTLGRLQNGIIRPTITTNLNGTNNNYSRKEYYCYSSGCLGVVAALSRYSMEDMWNIAHNIQQQWKSGQLNRYDVVTTFVDVLLFGRPQQAAQQQSQQLPLYEYRNDTINPIRLGPNDLNTLNIITTVKNDGGWGVKVSIRTPKSVQELRTMLIQTTWIPLAIGNDLWYDHHMDGAFTTSYHPKCQYQVGLAFDWDLYTNVVNVNLGRDKVEKFWNQGLEYGL